MCIVRSFCYITLLSPLPHQALKCSSQTEIVQLLSGKIPIIGVGGVFSGQDAFEKILAGASAVQIYTALIYHGPTIVTKIKTELAELLQRNGYKSVNDAVGKGVK